MPELPEVEAARRSMVRAVAGKTIARCVVLRPVAVRSHTPQRLSRAVTGATVSDVARHGKVLWFMLGRRALVFHYKAAGTADIFLPLVPALSLHGTRRRPPGARRRRSCAS